MDDLITTDPAICHGKPVVRGTRVPVSIILGSLAGGMTQQQVQAEYDLSEANVRAALAYAAILVDEEQHHALPAGG
jgi:uncharacterized protein (DUF433 family)